MALPFVTLSPFTGPIGFDELAQGLLKEVISADASMQLYQRAAWREAVGGSEVLEGLDRLENLGLARVRFTFHLEPVGTSWPARAWGVLTEPLGKGWFSRVAQLLIAPPRSFRLTPGTATGGMEVSISINREQGGEWKVHREPQPPVDPLSPPPGPASSDTQEGAHVARLVG